MVAPGIILRLLRANRFRRLGVACDIVQVEFLQKDYHLLLHIKLRLAYRCMPSWSSIANCLFAEHVFSFYE